MQGIDENGDETMKALVIASTAGFVRAFLRHDMELLQKMGYEVHCAANGVNHSFEPNEYFDTMSVVYHQIDFAPRSPFSKDTLKAAKQFFELNRQYQFDVIHCHTPIVGAIVRIVGMPAWLLKKHKIIYTTHGLAFPKGCPRKDKIIYGSIERLCSQLCDAVITINREDYAVMKTFARGRVYYINGVGVNVRKFHDVEIDRDEYRKSIGVSKDDILILAVGELSTRKNHRAIIQALHEMNDHRYVLVICGKAMIGEGTYEQLRRLAEATGVRVCFLGFRRDIPEITNCADIAVLPSIREGLGLAGVEALASGVPVIGSAVQGIKDYVIDGKTGFLCDPHDSSMFARRIKELSNPNLREKMRSFCVEKANEFSTEVSYQQMEIIYNEILEGMKGPDDRCLH